MITDVTPLTPSDSPRHYSTISLALCARQKICVQLQDRNNRPVDLGNKDVITESNRLNEECEDNCDQGIDADDPGFKDGIEPKHNWPDAKFVLKAVSGFGQEALFSVEGTVTDYADGMVVFHLDENHATKVGMYLAEIGYFRGDTLITRWPVYVIIEPSVFGGPSNAPGFSFGGMITVPEIRLFLRDTMPEDNYLLDEREFSDIELMHCIRAPIDRWNSTLPHDRALTYNYDSFPVEYRYMWIRATMGHALEIAAADYRRNSIPTNAGGVQLNDRDKYRQYDARAGQLLGEFNAWVEQAKYAASLGNSFGHVGSYRCRYWY